MVILYYTRYVYIYIYHSCPNQNDQKLQGVYSPEPAGNSHGPCRRRDSAHEKSCEVMVNVYGEPHFTSFH